VIVVTHRNEWLLSMSPIAANLDKCSAMQDRNVAAIWKCATQKIRSRLLLPLETFKEMELDENYTVATM